MPTTPAMSEPAVRRPSRSACGGWFLPLVLTLLATAALAQTPTVPAGGEFQVNTYSTSYQIYALVSVAADGGFVVAWSSYGSSGTDTNFSVQGQRYAADGSALGGEFQVTPTPRASSIRRRL